MHISYKDTNMVEQSSTDPIYKYLPKPFLGLDTIDTGLVVVLMSLLQFNCNFPGRG